MPYSEPSLIFPHTPYSRDDSKLSNNAVAGNLLHCRCFAYHEDRHLLVTHIFIIVRYD